MLLSILDLLFNSQIKQRRDEDLLWKMKTFKDSYLNESLKSDEENPSVGWVCIFEYPSE